MRRFSESRGEALLRYLKIRPLGVGSMLRFYLALFRAALVLFATPRRFPTVGSFILGNSPLRVKVDGVEFWVRPRSEDIGIAALAHEPDVARWFSPAPGQFCVDIGAHIGAYALRAARAGCTILAVEPNPSTFAMLKRNFLVNGFDSRLLYCAAAADGVGKIRLTVEEEFTGRSRIIANGNSGIIVPKTTVDALVGAVSRETVDWLIIDVEGSEYSVLRGATATLAKTARVIIEVEHGTEEACESAIGLGSRFKMMDSARYETVDYWYLAKPNDVPRDPLSSS